MSKRTARTREAKKELTRARLLAVARREFAERGFDGASVVAVCKRARVTHGALYHHFPSKHALFAAVVTELHRELAARVVSAVERESGFAQVEAACDAYLAACSEPAVQAILFRDGPRVLEHFGAIDAAVNEPFVTSLVQRWIDERVLRPLSAVVVARLIGAAIAEAGALEIALRYQAAGVLKTWLRALAR
ncbi:MAG: TetR/AcrR family transcriptional regulator [Labilithrix sp.]|nr:TetR/AcrR family transcriptional regulator [Labilithrix sp.]MCW5812152.1 TetR/AcrR family transcriptional regulator [Labilithrix sp.]